MGIQQSQLFPLEQKEVQDDFSQMPMTGVTARDVIQSQGRPRSLFEFQARGGIGNTVVDAVKRAKLNIIHEQMRKEYGRLLSMGDRGAAIVYEDALKKYPDAKMFLPPPTFFINPKTGHIDDPHNYYKHLMAGIIKYKEKIEPEERGRKIGDLIRQTQTERPPAEGQAGPSQPPAPTPQAATRRVASQLKGEAAMTPEEYEATAEAAKGLYEPEEKGMSEYQKWQQDFQERKLKLDRAKFASEKEDEARAREYTLPQMVDDQRSSSQNIATLESEIKKMTTKSVYNLNPLKPSDPIVVEKRLQLEQEKALNNALIKEMVQRAKEEGQPGFSANIEAGLGKTGEEAQKVVSVLEGMAPTQLEASEQDPQFLINEMKKPIYNIDPQTIADIEEEIKKGKGIREIINEYKIRSRQGTIGSGVTNQIREGAQRLRDAGKSEEDIQYWIESQMTEMGQ